MNLLRRNPTDPAVREIVLAAWKRAKHQLKQDLGCPVRTEKYLRGRPMLDADARRRMRNKRKKRNMK